MHCFKLSHFSNLRILCRKKINLCQTSKNFEVAWFAIACQLLECDYEVSKDQVEKSAY